MVCLPVAVGTGHLGLFRIGGIGPQADKIHPPCVEGLLRHLFVSSCAKQHGVESAQSF